MNLSSFRFSDVFHRIVRLMLCSHPYNRWPLHVKLFTEDAVKAWNNAAKSPVSTLPPGFTCSVELEGVDGKSKQIGSGRRRGPIDVEDGDTILQIATLPRIHHRSAEQFTSIYLAKNTNLMATSHQLKCSVCSEILTNYDTVGFQEVTLPAELTFFP